MTIYHLYWSARGLFALCKDWFPVLHNQHVCVKVSAWRHISYYMCCLDNCSSPFVSIHFLRKLGLTRWSIWTHWWRREIWKSHSSSKRTCLELSQNCLRFVLWVGVVVSVVRMCGCRVCVLHTGGVVPFLSVSSTKGCCLHWLESSRTTRWSPSSSPSSSC